MSVFDDRSWCTDTAVRDKWYADAEATFKQHEQAPSFGAVLANSARMMDHAISEGLTGDEETETMNTWERVVVDIEARLAKVADR
jgi:hypothetical protein